MRGAWLVAVLVLVSGCLSSDDPEDAAPAPPAEVTFEAIRFETEIGPIVVILYPEAAPETVAHMKTLVAEGYYDGREFNRAVPGHVIQLVEKVGGATDDPRRVPLETNASFHFSAGAAGIARDADPNSGGPEFFVMDFATSHLDGNYTVWGQVVEGIEAVHLAARVETVRTAAVPYPGAPPTGTKLDDLFLSDRTAVDAVAITRAEVTEVTLSGEEAARYPLKVATNWRDDQWRHSMDWPADLSAGRPAELTWYMRPYDPNMTAPLPKDVMVNVDGVDHGVMGRWQARGVYDWEWTPSAPGRHNATLVVDGRDVATLVVNVGPAP